MYIQRYLRVGSFEINCGSISLWQQLAKQVRQMQTSSGMTKWTLDSIESAFLSFSNYLFICLFIYLSFIYLFTIFS